MLMRAFTVTIAVLLAAQPAMADIVMLRSQKKLTGAIANREEFARDPAFGDALSILVTPAQGDSVELVRILKSDISYVVLENGPVSRVFDMSTLHDRESLDPKVLSRIVGDRRASHHLRNAGTALTFVGVVLLGTGIAVKFGGPKAHVTSSSISVEESSYNGANYALIMGGGVMVAAGGAILLKTAELAAQHDARPSLYLGWAARF